MLSLEPRSAAEPPIMGLFQRADRPGRKRPRRCGPLHRPRQDDRWVRLIAWPAH